MSKAPNRCRWCGGTGSSKEHSFADWIGPVMAPDLGPAVSYVFHHRSENPVAGVEPRFKTANGPAFFTRAFCESCNNGWMSRLETAAKKILTPMMQGQQRDLSSDDQQVLAFWAIKTLLAFQTMESTVTTFAADEDFRELYETQAPLGRAQVWIGAQAKEDSCWYRAHDARHRDTGQDGYGATMAIGRVAFYVLIGRTESFNLRVRGDAALRLREIWPGYGHSMLWPPLPFGQIPEGEGLAPFIINNSVLVAA